MNPDKTRTFGSAILIIVWFISLTGCIPTTDSLETISPLPQTASAGNNQATTSPTDESKKPDIEPTKTISPTSSPTATRSEPTETPSPTEGPSVASGPIRTCLGNGEVLPIPDDFNINGTILYQLIENFWGLHTFGGDPAQQSQLPVDQEEYYKVFGFSPDGKWLAYIPIPRGAFDQLWTREFVWEYFDLVLLSDTGEKIEHRMDITQFTLGLSRDEYSQQGPQDSYWINDNLIYNDLESVIKTEGGNKFLHRPTIFDPFKGTWYQEIIDQLPEIDISEIAFSSDLKRALYYKTPNHLAMVDLSSYEIIWENNDLISTVPDLQIKWAPDNSMAIIANVIYHIPDEFKISLITYDGKVNRIIANSQYPAQNFFPLHIEWSPDSRFIAMSHRDEIYIYDVVNDNYLFVCPLNTPFNIVWSPDSRYLAMGQGYESLRILDIEKEEILELLPYGIPVGWSETFPTDWP